MAVAPQSFFGGLRGSLVLSKIGGFRKRIVCVRETIAVLHQQFVQQLPVGQVHVADQPAVGVAVIAFGIGLQADFAAGVANLGLGVSGGRWAVALHRRVRFVRFGGVNANKAHRFRFAAHVHRDSIAVYIMVDAVKCWVVLHGLLGGRFEPEIGR